MNNGEKETFRYSYSAKEQDEIKRIREKYVSPAEEEDKMEKLRRLDKSVSEKATVVSLILGILGALVMGTGMSLVMTDIGARLGIEPLFSLIIGLVLGVIGIACVALAYPVYTRIVKRERERLAPEIIRLSEELLR